MTNFKLQIANDKSAFASHVFLVLPWFFEIPTMKKRILDIGNCGPDHAAIRSYLTRTFDCDVVQVDDAAGAFAELQAARFDLVLVNRKLDIDYSDGLDVIRQLKANAATATIPVMLVTNYADHQDLAVAAGALRGFGKLELGKPATRERLAAVLEVGIE